MFPIYADLPPPPPKRPCIVAPAQYRGSGRPTAVGSIVSQTWPIRVHYDRTEDITKAEQVLQYAELSWQKQVVELGFRAPVLPDGPDGGIDGPEFDLYLTPVGSLEAWTWAPQQQDDTPGDGMMGAWSYIAIDHNMPEIWIPSYTAHEFQHATQWATDFTEPTLPIWEGTANASQKWTLGEDSDWDYDVYSFQEVPWAPTLVGDGTESWDRYELGWTYEYGTALWVMWLDEKLGAGTGTEGASLWAETANEGWDLEPDAVDAIEQVSGMSTGQFLNEIAMARWLTGTRWDERGLADAGRWTDWEVVPSDATLATSAIPTQHSFSQGLMVTGQGFVELSHDGTPLWLRIRVVSGRGLHSGVAAFSWGNLSARMFAGDEGLQPELIVDMSAVQQAVIAVTNLGPADWDGDDDPWFAGDQLLSIEITDDPTAVPEEPEARACACSGAPMGPAGWLAVVGVLGLAARRRER